MSNSGTKALVLVGALAFGCDKDSPPAADAAKSSAKPAPTSEPGEPTAKPKAIPIGIVCTKFDAKATFSDGRLHVDLQTDLPPDIDLSFHVSRQYFEKGSSTALALDYLHEEGPIADWLGGKDFEISNAAAMQTYAAKQRERAAAGPVGELDNFSIVLEVSLVVRLTEPKASGTCQPNERGNLEASWKFKYPMDEVVDHG
jgi:hypothetical protein